MSIKRIACFFTGGFTELNAMKRFMNKINNQVQYIQLCPTGTRKSKDDIKRRHTDNIVDTKNGLTGESLINHIMQVIQSKKFNEEEYDAILIEDDKDERFLTLQDDGTSKINVEEWEQYKLYVRSLINAVLPDMPVIFIYAAPEIETWFLADWDNSFQKVYKKSLSSEQNSYFSVQFHKYIKEIILTPRYQDSLEEYGFFDNSYKKLSEEIQNSFSSAMFLSDPVFNSTANVFHYSKRIQGEEMLDAIDPDVIIKSCRTFFMKGMLELKDM